MTADDSAAIAAWLDGGLDAAGCAALAVRLPTDPLLARELFSQSAIDGQLRARFAATAVRQALISRVMQALPESSASTTQQVLRRIAQQRSRQRRRWLGLWAGAGLAAAALIMVLIWSHHQDKDGPFVIVCSGTVRQWPGGTVVTGTRIPMDGRVETGADGCLAVAYADGSRLALGGSGSLRFGGAGQALRLDAGRLEVNAAPQPPQAPLTIITPQGKVAVVGTRFGVAIQAGTTSVMVSSGTVAFSGEVGGVLSVRAGERAGVRAGEPSRDLPRPVFFGDGEDGTLGPFLQAGRLVAPPAGNASRWCLHAETRDWTPDQRQVAAGTYAQMLFAYEPALVLDFDYWLSPGVPWASVWLGNGVDYSIQYMTLNVCRAGSWQHASIRLGDLHADPDPTGRYLVRRADHGDAIGMIGFGVPEGGWELYLDNVCIAKPER